MKNSSQVIGLPIMGVTEGLEFGVVKDILIDPKKKKIKSIILCGLKSEYDIRELKLEDVTGIGNDYVITQSMQNAINSDLENPGMTLLKIRCISSEGNVLGNVKDYAFEEKTGDILSLQIDTGTELTGKNILSFINNLIFVDDGGKQAEPVAPSSLLPSLEEEQNEFMLGHVVKADIFNEYGEIIVKKDTVVTADIIRLAAEAGVTIELTLNLE